MPGHGGATTYASSRGEQCHVDDTDNFTADVFVA